MHAVLSLVKMTSGQSTFVLGLPFTSEMPVMLTLIPDIAIELVKRSRSLPVRLRTSNINTNIAHAEQDHEHLTLVYHHYDRIAAERLWSEQVRWP